jgi:two-component system invasion response regulator UvrY
MRRMDSLTAWSYWLRNFLQAGRRCRRPLLKGAPISQRVADLLASNCRKSIGDSLHHCLTPRELQIVSLLGAGKLSKQIAAALSIGISTVNTYRARIFSKMDLRSNAELIRYAVQHGLAD